VAAIGAEELNLLVPELLPVAIEFAFTVRTGHPKNFRHDSRPPGRNIHHRDAEYIEFGIFPKEKTPFSALSVP
jgi:hypothetical protein